LRLLVSGRETAPPPTNPCGYPYPPISDIIGWWDASCPDTLDLGPLGINYPVRGIADSIGNGNDMVKFNASYPFYNTTLFNTTYPGVLFTATDLGCLYCPNFPLGTGNTLTAWYVGTFSGPASGGFGRTLSYNMGASPGGFEVMSAFSNNTVTFYRGNFPAGLISTTGAIYPAGHRFIFTVSALGIMTIYIDGVASATVMVAGNWISNGTLLFGGEAGASSGGFWTGLAGEWGISTAFADASGVAALDAYLATKWGL